MTARLRGRVLMPAVALPLVVMLAACGGSSSGGGDTDADANTGAAGAACPGNIGETASTPLPSDMPAPTGSAPYESFSQGATQVWYFALNGAPKDLPALRDAYDNTLKAKGYEIEDTDQEANAEAESEFKGAHHGTTNFRPLCKGKVNFRLKLTS